MLNCATSDTTLCQHCIQTHIKEISIQFGIIWFQVGLQMTQCLLYVMFDMIFILRSFWWLHFNMCHMCDSYFYQLYLHSCFSSPPCVHRSSSFCLPVFFFFSLESFHLLPSIFPFVSTNFIVLFFPVFPPPRSIMCALYVSAHFRATHFMSEVVTPIVRDTLTWWGHEGSAWRWLLPHVSLLPASIHGLH